MSGIAGAVTGAVAIWFANNDRSSSEQDLDDFDISSKEKLNTKEETEDFSIAIATQKTLLLIKAIEDSENGYLTDKELCDIIQILEKKGGHND